MVLTVDFTVAGQPVIGLNGGPDFKFTEAVSFSIDCEDQAEVDKYWDALIAGGGEPSVCGWLKDRFGLSWQGGPPPLLQDIENPGRQAPKRATQAMLPATKNDVE